MTHPLRAHAGAILVSTALAAAGASAADWPAAGNDLKGSRHQAAETRINAGNAPSLTLKWSLDTSGDVTAHPAVDGDSIYFPDSAGFLYRVNRATGAVIWKKPVSSYTGIAGDFARATPAVAGGLLILGNQSGKFLTAFGQPPPQPARVFAVDKVTGDPVWVTQVDDTPLSFVTHSAIVANGMAFVGTASNEELVSAFVPKAYWQWHFRGSLVALDVATGALRWKSYTVPAGYAGGAIWGSSGAVDLAHQLVFMATGNNYMVPQAVLDCMSAGGAPAGCMSPDNHFDSIIAFEMATGRIRWGARGLPSDVWSVACGLNAPGFVVGPGFPGVYDNCPNGDPFTAGPDWDFGQGPMLFGGADGDNQGGNLVGAGAKSGIFWAFRAHDGKLAWSRQVSPGGVTGGMQWGSATDGKRLFVTASNAGPTTAGGGVGALPWTLKDGSVTRAGGWAALDAKSGKVLWTTKDPADGRAEAAVSSAGGVIFGCSVSGQMRALHAGSGQVLWSFNSGGPCTAGASIADGMVYWGSGNFVGPFGPKKVFAFGLP